MILRKMLFWCAVRLAARIRARQARNVAEAEEAERLRRLRELATMAIHDGQQAAEGKTRATMLLYQSVTIDGLRCDYGMN